MRISDWSSDVCSSDLPALDRRDSPPVRTRLSAPRARCCVASNDSSGIAPPAHQPCSPPVLVESAHVFIAAVSTLAQPEGSGERRHWPRRSTPFREDWIGKPSAEEAERCSNSRPEPHPNAQRLHWNAHGYLTDRT